MLKTVLITALLMPYLVGCITTNSDGFVNYKAIGDVYGTKPQAVDYEEVGTMTTTSRSFFWSSCDNICRDAINDLKYKSRDRGGDSLIDVSYLDDEDRKGKTPTCVTTWGWAVWTYGLGTVAPWIKTCEVEGVAVSRTKQKQLHQQAQENQAAPPPAGSINININNNQTNNGLAH